MVGEFVGRAVVTPGAKPFENALKARCYKRVGGGFFERASVEGLRGAVIVEAQLIDFGSACKVARAFFSAR